jgi:hypothetical protein
MKEKHETILGELFSTVDAKYAAMFRELAEYAVSLGYNPIRNKTSDITIDFKKNKIKKKIMKMEAHEQKHDGY